RGPKTRTAISKRSWACATSRCASKACSSTPNPSSPSTATTCCAISCGTDMPITPQEALQRTIEHRQIFHDEMVDLMRQIMRGEVSPTMTAAILAGLRVKKETVDEIAGAAQVLREFSTRVEVAGDTANFVDIVGTGGDGANTFNISTAAMFVVA